MRMQWIPGLPSPSPLRRPGDEANVYAVMMYTLSVPEPLDQRLMGTNLIKLSVDFKMWHAILSGEITYLGIRIVVMGY